MIIQQLCRAAIYFAVKFTPRTVESSCAAMSALK